MKNGNQKKKITPEQAFSLVSLLNSLVKLVKEIFVKKKI